MISRCLLIADDLTGGADAGAQFAKAGLNTLLISIKDEPAINFSHYDNRDVLVVNTDSRGLSPDKAFHLVSDVLKGYDKALFPIIYKKIDSTLRGNIGYEIDAILKETKGSSCFVAPTYPEQNRTFVGGILMVRGKSFSSTEVIRDAASPVRESSVPKLLEEQSLRQIGRIDLADVASGLEGLRRTVDEELKKGNKIIIFDAVTRQDLKNVTDVGFSMERKPLFVGSAGLAEEVAKKLSPSRTRAFYPMKPFKHILMVSGTASSITHQQLKRVEQRKIPSFQLEKSFIIEDHTKINKEKKELSRRIADSLTQGIVILKAPSEMLNSQDSTEFPIHLKIARTLASVALLILEASKVDPHDLALVLTGGETAQSVMNGLETEGIGIEGELLEGIVKGHLIGGNWDGLSVITKAGAFGEKDALKKIVRMLETGTPFKEE
jgi:uncharacterized protein YgbK (DUF1537 family)